MHVKSGFSLIEFAILLIVIGLIVGGVLVGMDMMHASKVRATLTQIAQYQSAVDRFFHKFGALPGDMNNKVATSFGFTPRGKLAGEGDGNGVIEGVNKETVSGTEEAAGETAMFWVDLTTAGGHNVNFIDDRFSTGSPVTYPDISAWGITETSQPDINAYLPAAKLGNGNYIYVWSDRNYTHDYDKSVGTGGASPNKASPPTNYYGLSAVTGIGGVGTRAAAGLTVAEAYTIDKKMDDGFPTTGNVTAQYITAKNFSWAGPYSGPHTAGNTRPIPATPGNFATCYDNNNVTGAAQLYSLDQDGGNDVNCGLSFKFPSSFQ